MQINITVLQICFISILIIVFQQLISFIILVLLCIYKQSEKGVQGLHQVAKESGAHKKAKNP